MTSLDHLRGLPKAPIHEKLDGLKSMMKVFAADGSTAFLTLSDLDLDTDGKRDPAIHYESTHQSATSLDPHGHWLGSNDLNYIVMPGGLSQRHGNQLKIGTLATVIYNGRVAHAVVADTGPHSKYGEGSIALHRALGFERIHDVNIVDCGIDRGVITLIYLGMQMGPGPFSQADIDRACAPLWAKFTS
jgi:hypothetical protein